MNGQSFGDFWINISNVFKNNFYKHILFESLFEFLC
jgi:hypothetical protein